MKEIRTWRESRGACSLEGSLGQRNIDPSFVGLATREREENQSYIFF